MDEEKDTQCQDCGHFTYEHDEMGRCWCEPKKSHRSVLDVKDNPTPTEKAKRKKHVISELGY